MIAWLLEIGLKSIKKRIVRNLSPHLFNTHSHINSYKLINSILFFLGVYIFVTFLIFLFNPFYLLRPLQIIVQQSENSNQISRNYLSETDVSINLLDLIKIENKRGNNYSVTTHGRINNYFQGIGNCSQQATAFGLILDSLGFNYEIVHILPKKNLLQGSGHSIIQVLTPSRNFLIDPLFKMMPGITTYFNDRLIDIYDLRSRTISDSNFHVFRVLQQKIDTNYYRNSFAVAYARVNSVDMKEYFSQNDKIVKLFRLRETKINKLIINAIAALTFKLPKFEITKKEFHELLKYYPYFTVLKNYGLSFLISIYCFIFLITIKVITGFRYFIISKFRT